MILFVFEGVKREPDLFISLILMFYFRTFFNVFQ